MFLNEIKMLLETKISPKLYNISSEIYGLHYVQPSEDKVIKKVMITIDLTIESLFFAVKNKINLIISMYGLINKPITEFSGKLITKLNLLSRYPINIFVLSNSFIAAEGGISDTIMEVLHLRLDKPFMIKNENNEFIPIGRLCLPSIYSKTKKILTMEELIRRVKDNFEMNKISYVGNLDKNIKKICIICTENLKKEFLRELIKLSCDCILTGKINDQIASFANEIGMGIIKISLFKSKILALKKLSNILSLRYPYEEFFFFDTKNPIKGYN